MKRPRASDRFDASPFLRSSLPAPAVVTRLGALWSADCVKVLRALRDESVDTVFADPPFNLGKEYGARTHDRRAESEYLAWCRAWLDECVRVLKPGGALFLYNLPKWNVVLGAHLIERGLELRHWIAIEMSASFPIAGRLHPSHYGLLYLTKGRPKTFRRIRTPIARCRHCDGELKDYGGHRAAMNPRGVTLKDVWTDIPPVRHWRFKSKERRANALSTKVLDRVIEMSTEPGDVVLDPFGGSGTTFAVCESRGRRWLGAEIDFAKAIAERLVEGKVEAHANDDVVDAPRPPRAKRAVRA
jgi:site-specific DNA-methyltransferase (adenine-specific)